MEEEVEAMNVVPVQDFYTLPEGFLQSDAPAEDMETAELGDTQLHDNANGGRINVLQAFHNPGETNIAGISSSGPLPTQATAIQNAISYVNPEFAEQAANVIRAKLPDISPRDAAVVEQSVRQGVPLVRGPVAAVRSMINNQRTPSMKFASKNALQTQLNKAALVKPGQLATQYKNLNRAVNETKFDLLMDKIMTKVNPRKPLTIKTINRKYVQDLVNKSVPATWAAIVMTNDPALIDVFAGITMGDGVTDFEGSVLNINYVQLDLLVYFNPASGDTRLPTIVPVFLIQWNGTQLGSAPDIIDIWSSPNILTSNDSAMGTISSKFAGSITVLASAYVSIDVTERAARVRFFVEGNSIKSVRVNPPQGTSVDWLSPISNGIFLAFSNPNASVVGSVPVLYRGTVTTSFTVDN